jgi:DMSO/TMAO reductase YedYZ heme-binding membrane subunit
VASTRSRPRGREHARPNTGGVAAEHASKIYLIAVIGIVVIIAFLALTSVGHVISAATQHFMLFYAGVFALIGLCASVGLGLVATDRMFLNPSHRVMVQSAHRAASFGAVTFLVVHIITQILAQRVHVIDAVIPFLSPFRTFYIGLGTIASDLIILLAITGILRGRFNASGKAWRWRALHYTSYAAFVFGVWHGLLGGRPGKPYVDWSYGFVVAFVLLGLAVRLLSNSLKPKESLSAPPVHPSAPSASAPLRAAAMAAQLSVSRGGRAGFGTVTGGQPALSTPLGAPVITATALPAGGALADDAQPYYEPGYEGPPRYLGTPRSTISGPLPQLGTGPMPRAGTGPQRRVTGSQPAYGTGPMPRVTGSQPAYGTGPMPQVGNGPQSRETGSQPAYGTGPMPRVTGSQSAYDGGPPTGPRPPYASGPMPRVPAGPPRNAGPRPQGYRPPTGPLPQAGGGRQQGWDGPPPRRPAGPAQWPGNQPRPREGSGPYPVAGGTGPYPAGGTSSYPAARGTGPFPAARGTGPYPAQGGTGPRPAPRWTEQSHDDDAWSAGPPPWDGSLPEADASLRYREPGPGMPGYRGARDQRYGGDGHR